MEVEWRRWWQWRPVTVGLVYPHTHRDGRTDDGRAAARRVARPLPRALRALALRRREARVVHAGAHAAVDERRRRRLAIGAREAVDDAGGAVGPPLDVLE